VTIGDVFVVTLGLAAIAWELWYFLVPAPVQPRPASAGVQDFRVLVKQGFEPDVIPVEVGRPVRLTFYRDETAECSAELIFDTLDIRRSLPAFEPIVVEFLPTAAGDYPFRCGVTMIRGRVVAQVGRDAARVNLGRGHSKHA
jgi:plastocyanin domain-containing protein